MPAAKLQMRQYIIGSRGLYFLFHFQVENST